MTFNCFHLPLSSVRKQAVTSLLLPDVIDLSGPAGRKNPSDTFKVPIHIKTTAEWVTEETTVGGKTGTASFTTYRDPIQWGTTKPVGQDWTTANEQTFVHNWDGIRSSKRWKAVRPEKATIRTTASAGYLAGLEGEQLLFNYGL